jgi:amino acid transporter
MLLVLKNSHSNDITCVQDAVNAAGPLLCIIGFVAFPLIWSVPEALMTAELATAFPENSGYVAWVTAAFGPMWGFQVKPGISCAYFKPLRFLQFE